MRKIIPEWFWFVCWALFGNVDDGKYGPEWFHHGDKTAWTAVKWWCRNPMHNLMFYVPPFGYAGWNWLVTTTKYQTPTWYGWKTLRMATNTDGRVAQLTFREFKTKRWEGYIGHRNRGNFGIALRRRHD